MSCSSAGSAQEWDGDGGSLELQVHLATSKGQPLVETGCVGAPLGEGHLTVLLQVTLMVPITVSS